MYVARLTLRNWGPYVGEHVLALGPAAYGVTASRVGDLDSSNWAGKTYLLEAVRFALHGWHRHRLEDDWISRTEDEGGVELVTSDGHVVDRRRTRNRATRLTFGQAKDDEAQRQVDELVGLAEKDFTASCFFEQKRMDRLLTMDAGERMKVVAGWLQLGPLQACESNVRARSRRLLDEVEVLTAKLHRHQAAVREVLVGVLGAERVNAAGFDRGASLAQVEAELGAAAEAKRALLASLRAEQGERERWAESARAARELAEVVEEGRALAERGRSPEELATLAADAEHAREHWASARARRIALADQVHGAKGVAAGRFDGRCPVADRSCPVTAEINADRTRSLKVLGDLEVRLAGAQTFEAECGDESVRCQGVYEDARGVTRSLEALRARARTLKAAAALHRELGDPPDDDLAGQASTAAQALGSHEQLLGVLLDSRRRVEEHEREAERVAEELVALRRRLDVHHEAALVLGRNGAQRRVAERALAEVEAGANGLLAACGVDLRLEVRWGREGKGLADACDACGQPFPASAKVKVCGRCGAARGPKVVDKLELVPSDRSGAAEDLCGVGFQLAAAGWLRRARCAPWASAVLDEPFGALDAALRRSFGARLSAMLSAQGFEQAFVVAHHAGTTDALPGRIHVVSEGGRSRVEVVG